MSNFTKRNFWPWMSCEIWHFVRELNGNAWVHQISEFKFERPSLLIDIARSTLNENKDNTKIKDHFICL